MATATRSQGTAMMDSDETDDERLVTRRAAFRCMPGDEACKMLDRFLRVGNIEHAFDMVQSNKDAAEYAVMDPRRALAYREWPLGAAAAHWHKSAAEIALGVPAVKDHMFSIRTVIDGAVVLKSMERTIGQHAAKRWNLKV